MAEEDNRPKCAKIYDHLVYGPAPESDEMAQAWIDRHERKFAMFIDNEWVMPEDPVMTPISCPSTGEQLYEVVDAGVEGVDRAVAAAEAARASWAATSPHERARLMYALTRQVQKHGRLLSVLEALDNGKSVREARDIDIPLVARHLYHHAGWAQLSNKILPGFGPLKGPIAAITPLNFPLLMLIWKVAPALAMGNTLVLKPAPLTPLTALCFSEICASVGLPKGVINLVCGGRAMAERLTAHPDVAKVDFCGSTVVGQAVRRATAGTGKGITLQMSGKSPLIVMEDADLDSAVEGVVDAIYRNQGQICSAGSRLIVQESVADRFIAKLKRRMGTLRLDTSLDKAIDMSAVLAGTQRIQRLVDAAREEGATIWQPDLETPATGDFWVPTLVTDVEPTSIIVQTEVFGPVLVALTFRDPKEAVALANNTRYGLGGGVYSENISVALDVANRIKSGIVWVNSYNLFDAAGPFGGRKETGYGRQGSFEGLMNYVKPTWMPFDKHNWDHLLADFPAQLKRWSAHQFGLPAPADTPVLPIKIASIDKTAKIYIGGKQKRPDYNYVYNVLTPEGQLIEEVADSNRKDVRDAVEAAHKAAPGWGKRAAHNRAQILFYIAENLDYRRTEFAGRIQAMTGRTEESCLAEVDKSIDRLFTYAAHADKYGGRIQETPIYGVTMSLNDPIGVIAIVCPEEFPLLGFVSTLAPAICRGNSVVIVPSEKAPLCATDLYQVLETSDLPGGVINIITGNHPHLARHLAEHQDITQMWHFGDAESSFFIEHLSHLNCKRTWCTHGFDRDFMDDAQGEGVEFLHESVEIKTIWVPFGF